MTPQKTKTLLKSIKKLQEGMGFLNNDLVNEVKTELLETAEKLLGKCKKLMEAKKSKSEKKAEKDLLKTGKHPDLGKNMEWYEKLAAKKAKKDK